MKKFLVKVFTWLSESITCEQAMYEALYETRVAPLLDKIVCKNASISKLEKEVADLKTEINAKQAAEMVAKPKRKYNKRKKADDKA